MKFEQSAEDFEIALELANKNKSFYDDALYSRGILNNDKENKVLPKLTIVGIPSELTNSDILDEIRAKDCRFDQIINGGSQFEVIKCWDIKNSANDTEYKKIVVKCSPDVREHFMDKNGGYIYLGLVRCKCYDRFIVTQCYHCQGFNHYAYRCPQKSLPPICGTCSEQHETKNCNSNVRKCINCIKFKPSVNPDHSTRSDSCPCYMYELKTLKNRTATEKNLL